MDGGKDTVENIGSEIIGAHGDDSGIVSGKEAKNRHRLALNDEVYGKTKAYGGEHSGKEGLPAAPMLSGAGILGDDGRDGREHGRRYQKEKGNDFLDDADGRCRVDAPLVGNHCDK